MGLCPPHVLAGVGFAISNSSPTREALHPASMTDTIVDEARI